MASTLRDELASLRIERSEFSHPVRKSDGVTEYRRRGSGLRLLSWLLWLIPLSIIGGAGYVGYREYDRVRSKSEVTIGLVQRMTTGEAEKLLSAKGYLKSQKQAMIGTKVAGRVEEMRVREHDQVKAGAIMAVIEHHDLLAMIEQRKAGMERTKAELEESGPTSGRKIAKRIGPNASSPRRCCRRKTSKRLRRSRRWPSRGSPRSRPRSR